MDKRTRDKFRKHGKVNIPKKLLKLSVAGKRGKGCAVGQEWDAIFKRIIREEKISFAQGTKKKKKKKSIEQPERQLLRALNDEFGINFLVSQFPLYGYMYSKTETQPKIYFWNGDADAIGWYIDSRSKKVRYVIVEWKVLPNIATFWEESPDAYGKHLHQGLIYAKLLQLHIGLDYLPHILIVPINGETGKDFHPALFSDYPKECKDRIESFEWSVNFPEQGTAVKIPLEKPFNKEKLKKGEKVDKEMLLSDFFAEGATVGELMKTFGWPSLQVK